ncbi:M12 family metallopeptidase [endosymbiont of Lamellibrachia barhami]|uniref:M12 family metallopeptidase n=1 Tax=endosymbiont of Lamellibrachia barhami TaxID=205975 RepID=UPI0015AA9384|nr:M12 family metallopeptidase [endosymbiont of Lamellibrachia barhami]
MAVKKKPGARRAKRVSAFKAEKAGRKFCDMPEMALRQVPQDVDPGRAAFILDMDNIWVNGTVIHYCFFEHAKHNSPTKWTGSAADKRAVRKAFKEWKDLGIGLEFVEVRNLDEAEIRIGFDQDEGSWSYIGTYPMGNVSISRRTMNFGWSLTTSHGKDTALHEIGHSLGAKHEHQNPFSGIQWNRQGVYDYFSGPPNNWSRRKIDSNILDPVSASDVEGSGWDSNSIMHYEFRAALIEGPPPYDSAGIHPAADLSPKDKAWAQHFYPALRKKDYVDLIPFQSEVIQIEAGGQVNLVIKPKTTRKYTMQSFGEADTLMVLFEDDGTDDPIYLQADDDSGSDYNAKIEHRLMKGTTYILRVRLYWANAAGETAVMLW